MSREYFSPWADGLSDEEFAKAIAALGLAAARTPDVLAGVFTAAEIASRLRADLQSQSITASDSSRGPLDDPWPVVTWRAPRWSGWDPATTQPAHDWAAAWDELGFTYSVRFALTLYGDLSPRWLAEILRGAGVSAVSSFVDLPTRLSDGTWQTPWRFPLRIGFLDGQGGRAARDQLVEAFGDSSWRAVLIDPMIIGRERVTCDVLVLTTSPYDALRSLRGVRQVRAGAVLGLHALDPWDDRVVLDIAVETRAWAVGFCEVPDPADWLVELCRQLSHNLPLDWAFEVTTSHLHGVLAAQTDDVDQQRAAYRARVVAQSLRLIEARRAVQEPGTFPPRGEVLASEFDRIASTGRFVSESGEASELVELERRSAPLVNEATAARWLQARITPAENRDVSLDRFRANTAHVIDVRIGPSDIEWLEGESPFPEESTAPVERSLTIMLTEPHLLARPLVESIALPAFGASEVISFELATQSDTTEVDARLTLLSGNRVLQTARLPREVDAIRSAPSDTAVPWSAATTRETFVAPAISDLGDRRAFDAAFIVNKSDDGIGRLTAVSGRLAGVVRLDDRTLVEALTKISKRLGEIVEAPDDFVSLDDSGTVELLIFLARSGAQMRQALVTDSLNLAPILARSRYLQVVSAKPDAFFPFEFAYDFPAPAPDAELCPAAALASDDPDLKCHGLHTSAVVCPLGFWGLTRVIERHAFEPADEVAGTMLLRGTPVRDRDLISLGPIVFAASDRVDSFLAGSIDGVTTTLKSTAGTSERVSAWTDWSLAVAQDKPALLMLLPHTVFSEDLDEFGLEIGSNSTRWAADIAADFLPPEDRPALVALLGCETARAGEVGYERFPSRLRLAGAAVVIATLTEILGRHAAPLAGRLVEELYASCASEPRGVGEVMVRLRRRLVADGVLPVLALVAFGDADWLVTKASP
ncbi:CHAT domain-containing protein [Kribbella jiaozuonensis]|uniref:CHAT domain-containing protein n=1 Tax=Kribbella jiaozuonensis TaxID=2575441 RepID=A0A4U3M385_9ACTN|nr:CHAT domain-containing protein [Kribbella jiaozuonensis]TKK82810.1 CHAT domain-containing protein [Kribbella jiaozuonensis]